MMDRYPARSVACCVSLVAVSLLVFAPVVDAKEKKEAKKKSKKKVTVLPRLRIVWAVCDHIRKIVKAYHYTERDLAEAHAARLTKSKNKEHVVRPQKVPMED